MSAASSSTSRRRLLVTSAAASALALVGLTAFWHAQPVPAADPMTPSKEGKPMPDTGDIRPFRVSVPDKDLAELRRRIAATRWPEKETVADQSQGVPLATMRELANYWGTTYDWRRVEAKLNSVPPSAIP